MPNITELEMAGRKIETITIIPTIASVVLEPDAIENTESILDESKFPTTGTNEPTALFIECFNIESEEDDKNVCNDIENENNVINAPITHLINFLICLSSEDIFIDAEKLDNKANVIYTITSGIKMLSETVSSNAAIKDTEVEKTEPEKEFPEDIQSPSIIGIADEQNTFVDSMQSLIFVIQLLTDGNVSVTTVIDITTDIVCKI